MKTIRKIVLCMVLALSAAAALPSMAQAAEEGAEKLVQTACRYE